jgi:DNA-binding transcriptional LysR family regulator
VELKDLKLFVEVATAAGFRRAATHLDMRQSVISRRIRDLEDELGASLFERHRGGVRLTNAGTRFLSDVRPILAQPESAVSAVQANGHVGEGRLRLGASTSISAGFLRWLLESWISQYPAVTLDIREAGPRDQLGEILNRRIDVTFLTGDHWPPGCDAEHLWTDQVYVAVPNDTVLSSSDVLAMGDLAGEHFLVTQDGFGPEIRDFIIKRLSNLGISPTIEVLDVARELLLTMVGLRRGITLTSSLETGIAYPNVTFIRVVDEELPFSAVWSPENDNPALRRFLSLARVLAKQQRLDAPSRTPDPSP